MDQKKIGRYIAEKRKRLGLTQAQLAEQLGMSNKSVSKWERGVCLPDVSIYMSLCNILGISINEFLAGEDIAREEFSTKLEDNLIHVSNIAKKNKRRLKACFVVIGLLILVFVAIQFEFTPGTGYRPSDEANKIYSIGQGTETYEYLIDQVEKETDVTNIKKIGATIVISLYEKDCDFENDIYYSALLIATGGSEIRTVIWKISDGEIVCESQYDFASFRYAFGNSWHNENISDYGKSPEAIQELIERFRH